MNTPTSYRGLSPLTSPEIHAVWEENPDHTDIEEMIYRNPDIHALEMRVYRIVDFLGMRTNLVELCRTKARQITFKMISKNRRKSLVDLIGVNDYGTYFSEIYESLLEKTLEHLRDSLRERNIVTRREE
jgi:hypothetical protein